MEERFWSVAEARDHFSEIVRRAVEDGPQVVTRRGQCAVIVVSVEDWERRTRRRGSLAEFFAASPLRGSGLAAERSDDAGRTIEL